MSYFSTRLGWLAVCFAFFACASGPEPRSASSDGDGEVSKKRKKKKKKKKSVAQREAEEERRAEAERKEEEEREKQIAKEEDDAGEVSIVDTDVEPEPKKAKSKKPAKKPKVEEEPEEVVETPKKKKNREIEEEPVESDADSEDTEAADKATTKTAKKKQKKPKEPEVVAAKAKKKPKAEEEPIPEIELDTEPEPEPEPAKKPKVAAKRKNAAAEPRVGEDGVIEMTGEEEDDPLVERRVAAIPVPGVDDDSSPIDEPEAEPATPGTWPLQINDRPLTIAKSKLAVHGGLDVYKVTLPNLAGTPVASTATGLALGATYGLSDKAEVGLDYVLGVSPGDVAGPLTLHAAYRAVVKPKLELAVAGGIAVDSDSVTNETTMVTTKTTYVGLELGAWVRYRLGRKASLFSGVPATPASTAVISKLSFALPPMPYQLAIGLTNKAPIAFDVPVGLGYQVTPNVYAYGMLNLAHFRIANTVNAFVFRDFIPIALGGFYTRKQIDVGVTLSDDLDGNDFLRFDLLLRYAIK